MYRGRYDHATANAEGGKDEAGERPMMITFVPSPCACIGAKSVE